MKKIIFILLFLAGTLSVISGTTGFEKTGKRIPFKHHSNSIILHWNTVTQEIMKGPAYNPMNAARIMAMVHIAMHDALNNIVSGFETYAFHQENKKADPIVAVSAAAHAVLVVSFPDKKHDLDNELMAIMDEVRTVQAKQHGLVLGRAAGNAIVALRKDDDAFRDPIAEITNPKKPGLYQPVPPMPFLYAPFWKDIPTFGIERPDQFRIEEMPGLSSETYTKDFKEVKEKGALNNSTRNEDETSIAKFWYEFSEIGWNRITATVATQKKLDLLSTARLFALVNMALSDAYVAGWDSKIHYNFWRPYTAIRSAATDGNDYTQAKEDWEPLMATPPVQDYPSTHSALGKAASIILANEFGDNTNFTFGSTSAVPANSTRSFHRFSQAAEENADSRVLAGLHFRFSCEKGLALGEKVGQWIVQNQLKPIETKRLSASIP